MTYLDFLQSKINNKAVTQSTEYDTSLIHPSSKPHQCDVIEWALEQQCALIAASFGLGKTQIETEIARLLVAAHPDTKFLIVCPLGVRHQFINSDGPRLGIEWQYVYNDETLAAATTPFVKLSTTAISSGQWIMGRHSHVGSSATRTKPDGIRYCKNAEYDATVPTLFSTNASYRIINECPPNPTKA